MYCIQAALRQAKYGKSGNNQILINSGNPQGAAAGSENLYTAPSILALVKSQPGPPLAFGMNI
jgi:hypothetical protein